MDCGGKHDDILEGEISLAEGQRGEICCTLDNQGLDQLADALDQETVTQLAETLLADESLLDKLLGP